MGYKIYLIAVFVVILIYSAVFYFVIRVILEKYKSVPDNDILDFYKKSKERKRKLKFFMEKYQYDIQNLSSDNLFALELSYRRFKFLLSRSLGSNILLLFFLGTVVILLSDSNYYNTNVYSTDNSYALDLKMKLLSFFVYLFKSSYSHFLSIFWLVSLLLTLSVFESKKASFCFKKKYTRLSFLFEVMFLYARYSISQNKSNSSEINE